MEHTIEQLENLDATELAHLVTSLENSGVFVDPAFAAETIGDDLAGSPLAQRLASGSLADRIAERLVSERQVLAFLEDTRLVSEIAESRLACQLVDSDLASRLSGRRIASQDFDPETREALVDRLSKSGLVLCLGELLEDGDFVNRLTMSPAAEKVDREIITGFFSADLVVAELLVGRHLSRRLADGGISAHLVGSRLANDLAGSSLAVSAGSSANAALILILAQQVEGALLAAFMELVVLSALADLWFDTQPPSEDFQIEARMALFGTEIAESSQILEPALGKLQQVIDDARTPLGLGTEMYLRAQVGTIREQHRSIDEVDLPIVNRAIGKIVARLLEIHEVGPTVRDLLQELGTEPPEVIDQVVNQIEMALRSAANLQLVELEPAIYVEEAAEPIVSSAAAAENAGEVLDVAQASWSKDSLTKFGEGFSTQLGKRTADAAVAGLMGFSALMMARYGVGFDEVMVHFADLMRQLQHLYLTRR